jgi:hypothetical protein
MEATRMSNPAETMSIDKRVVLRAFESLDWMIRYMEWANEQTGLSQGPSPELQKAIEARDAMREELAA